LLQRHEESSTRFLGWAGLGACATLEGREALNPPEEGRVVVVEFPSMERLRRWYAAVGYAEALKISEAALSRRRLLVEGVED
jgi:uncharacterized protein (DUF1330 family)